MQFVRAMNKGMKFGKFALKGGGVVILSSMVQLLFPGYSK